LSIGRLSNAALELGSYWRIDGKHVHCRFWIWQSVSFHCKYQMPCSAVEIALGGESSEISGKGTKARASVPWFYTASNSSAVVFKFGVRLDR